MSPIDIARNGVTLRAYDSGNDGTLAVIFLHYWGGTAQTWDPVVGSLSKNWRTITLDARGWGESSQPADGYDMVTMADDVQLVIATLKLEKYVLVGHSMGGKVAQLLASRCPPGLVGLVLVAPSPAQGKRLTESQRRDMSGAYTSVKSIEWTVDNVLSGHVLSPSVRAKLVASTLAGGDEAKAYWPLHGISEDVSERIGSISVPILIVGGDMDKVDTIEMLRRIVVASLPRSKLEIISGAGHLLPVEASHQLVSILREFISEIESKSC